MIQLRPYQQRFKARIDEAWLSVRSVLGVLPTGMGKTLSFASIVHDHQGAAAVVVHRKEIIRQISLALAQLEVPHRIVAPPPVIRGIRRRHLQVLGRSYVDPHAAVGVVSVQKVTSASSGRRQSLQRWLAQVTLAVFDEGHHYVRSGHWGRAVELFDRAKLLFVTATPKRADGKGLGAHADGYVEALIEGPSVQWGIDNGYLCKFRYFCPSTDFDVSDLTPSQSGDYTNQALRKRAVESHIVGDVVAHYRRYADGLQAILFAPDVETAMDMAEAFKLSGIRAVALSGKTDASVRDKELEDFEARRTQVLINVDLFDEGFDVPAVEAIIHARPTESLAKYLQMCGRGLRPFEGKTHTVIIDAVRNVERHGPPNAPRQWSLDRRDKATRGESDTIPQRICHICTQPYEAYFPACPYCGAGPPEPAGRSRPEQVDGDLTELDVDALNALFADIRRADMTDEEYERDMIARNVPPVGRGKQLRRHQADKYRRQVLREMVGWWDRLQPDDRSLSERYRRFYHRFGIDRGQAFTLNAADTDRLISKIAKRFSDDIVQ